MGEAGREARGPSRPAALAAVVAAVVWAPSLANDFVWDDRFLVAENDILRRPDALRAIFTQGLWAQESLADLSLRQYYRPVVLLAWWIVQQVSRSPVAFHALNVALHAVATGLAVVVIRRVAGVRPLAALVGGLLFAVHGSRTGSVAWITGLLDVLPAIPALAALALAASPVDSRERARSASIAALCALALLGKETSAVIPALVIAVAPAGMKLRAMLLRAAPSALVVGLAGVARVVWMPLGGERWPIAFSSRAGLALESLGRFARLTAWPTSTVQDTVLRSDVNGNPALSGTHVALGAAALAAVLALAAWAWKRGETALRAAPLLWFIPLGLALNFVWPGPIHPQVALARYLYLPLVGVAVLLAWGVDRVLDRAREVPRWAALAIVALAFAWLPARLGEQEHFRDEGTFFRHELDVHRDDPQMAQALSARLVHERRTRAAYEMSLRAVELWRAVEPKTRVTPAIAAVTALDLGLDSALPPDAVEARRSLAQSFDDLWNPNRARAVFILGSAHIPLAREDLPPRNAAHARAVHATILSDLGDDRAAMATLARGLAECPGACEPLVDRALKVFVRTGDVTQARGVARESARRGAPTATLRAWDFMIDALARDLTSTDPMRVGRALLATGAPGRALAALPPEGRSPEADAVRVEALLSLQRVDEAEQVIARSIAPTDRARAEALAALTRERRRADTPWSERDFTAP